jgi:serine/threonine protein phosphatase PrpC
MSTPLSLAISLAAASHRGAVRASNQDAAGAFGWLVADGGVVATAGPVRGPATVVVADGAGGHPAGDVASRLAVAHLLGPRRVAETADELADLVRSAHVALHEHMRSHPSTAGMATTVAALAITERSVLVGHVGDSRVYELLEDGVTLLTDDDRVSADRGVLTQALGGPSLEREPTPHLSRLACEPGLRFLLCSDGVPECVSESTLRRLAGSHADDAALVAGVLEAALAAGAPDNVTVVVASVDSGGGRE